MPDLNFMSYLTRLQGQPEALGGFGVPIVQDRDRGLRLADSAVEEDERLAYADSTSQTKPISQKMRQGFAMNFPMKAEVVLCS